MTDEISETNCKSTRLTRRGVLALAGASAIAGCSSLDSVGGGGEATIDTYNLPDIPRHGEREAPVSPSVPVDIATSHFDVARERVRSLLATLPTPLGPEEIPNGHIRQHLTDAASDASDGLDDARTARTGLMALRSLRRARENARYAASGWGVADRGLTAAPLRNEYDKTLSAARETLQEHEYVGADPVRAALVHARIEAGLGRATDTDVRPREESELLSVAEWGEMAESAQAYLSDARHLRAQFTASLPANVGTVRQTLTAAAKALLSDIRDRQSDLPPETNADDRNPGQMVFDELRWEVESGISRFTDAVGPASAVVDANSQLARLRAIDRIQSRRETGELVRPSDGKTVRDIRETVYEALTAALESSSQPELVRTVLVDAGHKVMAADRGLTHHQGEISASTLDRNVADYWHATALARSASAATQQTVQALESG
ncbi:hypothetical protein [Haloarcula argentinensis]|uniref:Uncharacterized protein n=1 Tax=Haloarcula argentinensis TaxID=43776 RepID=A0ABU2F4L0_HALAR|nr:hypothetical protein [Haloarcula argentinensis]EMA26342.1 hypothetical protein C443_01302 [Haloarcula argentinensis DSM 12282]MDS0255523.1 hypothetical protein [Haloarcula argentinensis]